MIFLACLSASAEQVPDEYREALALMNNKKYVQAMEAFQAFHQKHPNSVSALYNWGLSAYQVERHGLAVALWRRALYLSANFTPAAQALDYAQEKLSSAVFAPPSAGSIENFKSNYLRRLSLSHILLVHFLLFTFTSWLTIRFFARRKKAFELEEEPPRVNFVHILFAGLFIMSSYFLILALDFKNEARATIIEDQVALKTAPQEDANEIFSVLEGSEVIIEDVDNDWTLVTYPGGMTGWVNVSKLYQNNGSKLW